MENAISYNDLKAVYERLKERYCLTLTNTAALDDGFTADIPILVGEAHGQIVQLYVCDDIFVLDVMNDEKTKGTHWHPYDVHSAVKDVAEFMEGKADYKMSSFR